MTVHSQELLAWALTLGLAASAASAAHFHVRSGAASAQSPTFDADRTAAVSFARSSNVTLVDAFSGQALLELQARHTVRALALAANGDRLIVASPSGVESINIGETTDRQEIAVPGADRVATGAQSHRVYCAHTRPAGISALPLPSLAPAEWTARTPSRVRALAVDESSGRLLVGHDARGIEVLDAVTGAIQRRIDTERPPVALALTSDGRTAIAALRDGTVTALDVADASSGTSTRVVRRPRALAISPDDRLLYVLDAFRNAVVVVDRNAPTAQQTVQLPAKPYDMALSPDGSRLLVTSPPGKAVFVIDTGSLMVTRTLRFSQPPSRVAFASRRASAGPAATRTVGSPNATATPTTAPGALQGVAVGTVFDDGSAQPLPDVLVQTRGAGTSTATDANGRYVVAERPALIELTKDGYTRAVRQLNAPDGTAVTHVLDSRLTRRSPPSTIGTAGGVVTADYALPDAAGVTAELTVAPGALLSPVDIQLTVVSPQALIAPLPLGWSVLLGIDLRATQPVALSATLRLPLALLSTAMSLPVNVAVWDDGTAQWRAAAPATVRASAIEVAVASLSVQLALIVADTIPTSPPAMLMGAPVQGVPALQQAGASAFVTADPDVVVAGADIHTRVQTQVRALAPLPSGSRLMIELREHYELRDGRQIATAAVREDLLGYQLGAGALQGGSAGGTVGAYFTIRPRRTFDIGELTQGRITIDTLLPQDEEPAGVVGIAGGEILGLGGLRLHVPASATNRITAITLQPAAASDLPAGVTLRTDLISTLRLDIVGGMLAPTASYSIDLGTALPDGQRFVLARAETVDSQSVLVLAAFGHSESGGVIIDACPVELNGCLPGLTGSGTYALFLLPTGVAVAAGTVADSTGVRPGLSVRSDTAAVVSVTDPAGQYVLPIPLGVSSTLSSNDAGGDLSGTATVTPSSANQIITTDIELQPTVPVVIQVHPANHGSGVALDTTITLRFSEPIAAASLTSASVRMARVVGASASLIAIRSSLSTDGTQLLLTPDAALLPEALYRVIVSGAVTDRSGTPLVPFESDFTTSARFKADALPPDTLWLSLPDPDGSLVVCGGPQLALPGTFVTIVNDTSGTTFSGVATDRSGTSGSDVCDALFPGRCDTSQPGSFCAVIDAGLGDKILVTVDDALGDQVTLDAGLMRDEVTGATAVGPDGGAVLAASDQRYRLDIPPAAFESTVVVTITPLTADDVPHTADATLEFVGAAYVDLGGQAASRELHLSVPAPPDPRAEDQFVATKVVSDRGFDELTVIDTASIDSTAGLLTTNSPPFGGVIDPGSYILHRASRCLAWVSGVASTITNLVSAFIPGRVDLPFFLHGAQSSRFTLPVPCDEPVQLTLNALTGEEIDSISLSTAPQKGEFVFLNEANGQGLFADKTAPEVIGERTSIPDAAMNVGHDAEISVPFNEPVLTSSLGPGNVKLICTINGRTIEMQGTWSQSEDGKRIFFVAAPGSPQRGLPFGAHCRVRVSGVKDLHGNVMRGGFFEMTFDTFQPTVIDRKTGFDARAVDAMGWRPNGQGTKRQYVTFAEGTGHRPDWAGGLLIVDHTSLSSAMITDEQPTPGLDRAVRFIEAEDFHDRDGQVFHGPYLMSLDGAGDESSRDRFGVWRLFDLASFPLVSPIASRIINHSADSLEQCNSLDPGTLHLCNQALHSVPNDIGVPLSLASIGAQVAFVVDAPFVGIEAIQLNDIDRNSSAQGVDGLLQGHYRAVDTLKGWVIGRLTDGLIIRHPSLDEPAPIADVPLQGGGLALATLENWPVDLNGNGRIDSDEKLDLVVTSAVEKIGGISTPVLYVTAVESQTGTFAPRRLEGLIALPPDSQPFRIYPDPERRLLYVANGTVGLTIVDFQDPRGSLDEDGGMDLIDDRVLGSVSLQGAMATDVATDITLDTTANGTDRSGRVVGYVAAQADGWFWVDLGPGRMETKLVGYAEESASSNALVEPAAVRYFNEHRTALYQVEAKIPNHLTDLYPTVDVRVEAVDWDHEQPITVPTPIAGSPFPPIDMQLAPAAVTVQLTRVPGTNRYTMPRNASGQFADVVVASNLPVDELDAHMRQKFPTLPYHAVYAGIGTKLKLSAQVAGTWLQGKTRTIPLEKVDVIILGIDGLRQDVLYPASENDVQEPGVNYHIDPLTLTGIGQVLGGVPNAGGGVSGDLDRHHLRMRGVSAIFPSITLASWASIFTGQPPGVTGILGNEFFIRPPAPNLPFQKSGGIVTLSEGAFDRSNAENLGLTPPGSTMYLSDPALTAQNNPSALLAQTIFEQLRTGDDPYLQALRDRYRPDGQGGTKDDLSVVAFNHYARGATRWLTMTDSQKNTLFPLTVLPGVREGWPLDKIPSDNFVDYLNRSLRKPPVPNPAAGLPLPGDRNDRPFPALTTLYLAGVDHDAHGGHGTNEVKYKQAVAGGPLGTSADGYVDQVIEELHSLGELYNKVFILTADHGHTRITDDPNEFTPCALEEPKHSALGGVLGTNWLAAMGLAKKRIQETDQNNNLHIWELARIITQGNELQSAFHPKLLVPDKLGGLAALGQQWQQSVTQPGELASQSTLVATLNGTMAHLYVRPANSNDWSVEPTEGELGVVAEILRLFLMNGGTFDASGRRIFSGTSSQAFGLVDEAAQSMFLASVDLPRLVGSVDLVLVRLNGEYVVYNGLEADLETTPTPAPSETPTPTGTDTPVPNATASPSLTPPTPGTMPTIKIRALPLAFLSSAGGGSGRERYVDVANRLVEMNHPDRSGDIILLMRDDTDVGPPFRFTTGVACRGWHASLSRADSYVPLMLTYPGGNRLDLEDVVAPICHGSNQCSQNRIVPELVRALLQREYLP